MKERLLKRRLWNSLDPFFYVGEVVGRRGLHNPYLKILHLPDIQDFLDSREFLFITIDKKPVPFRVLDRYRENYDKILVQLDGITVPEATHKLVNQQVLVLEDEIRKFYENKPYVPASLLLDYVVIDSKGEEMGRVKAVNFAPNKQILLVIDSNPELVVTLQKPVVSKISHDNQVVYLGVKKEDLYP